MNKKPSQWKTASLTKTYLEGVRGAIPAAELQIEVLLKIVRRWCPNPESVLDLGCGDGILGRAVWNDHPDAQIWFVDFSDPMIASLRDKLGQGTSAKIIEVDFSTPDWLNLLTSPFTLILSGFSIHHQSDERKRQLYKEIYGLLSENGVFLNLEHVSSATSEVEAIFDDYFIDHLYAFNQLESNKTRDECASTYCARPDKEENILASVEEQCEWLRQIGFKDVDCFFKIFELAVFGGRRRGPRQRSDFSR